MQNISHIIIFGAAVKANGEPSGAMKRRIDSALLIAKELINAVFIVTGGIGTGKIISEADAMRKLLVDAGIQDENILIEDKATDTLSSAEYCSALLNARNITDEIFVCSDTYHIPRCRWLFYLFGIRTKSSKVISGINVNGLFKWVYYYIREIVATPYDTVLVYLHKLGIKTL